MSSSFERSNDFAILLCTTMPIWSASCKARAPARNAYRVSRNRWLGSDAGTEAVIATPSSGQQWALRKASMSAQHR